METTPMYEEPYEVIKVEEHFKQGAFIEGKTLKIFPDPDPMDPRSEWDNFGHMVCWHGRYRLGDKNDVDISDCSGWDEIEEHLRQVHNAYIVLNLYLMDHSGITMRTGSFHDPWDSGQVGFIYATRADICKEFSVKRVTKAVKEKAYKILEQEVETYDEFLTGRVYGYVLEDKNGEEIDSCWGYYGGADYIKQEVLGVPA
jgi:hypothetical protein